MFIELIISISVKLVVFFVVLVFSATIRFIAAASFVFRAPIVMLILPFFILIIVIIPFSSKLLVPSAWPQRAL